MDESDLIARLTALEEANKPQKKVESFWVVHDPAFVKIWCPKSSCPNLGRKIEVEVQQIKASEAQGLTEDGEVKDLEESDEIIESKIIIDKGPSKSNKKIKMLLWRQLVQKKSVAENMLKGDAPQYILIIMPRKLL